MNPGDGDDVAFDLADYSLHVTTYSLQVTTLALHGCASSSVA
jgi:hypothetical protein